MLKMVDGTGIIGVDMICPLGISTPQPPNYDRVELEGAGMLVLPNSLDAPLERLELGGKTEQLNTRGVNLWRSDSTVIVSGTKYLMFDNPIQTGTYTLSAIFANDKSASESLFAFYNEQNQNVGGGTIKQGGRQSKTFTLTGKAVKVLFYASSGYDSSQGVTTTIKEIQLETGTTATTYEPYTGGKPSPSPEYPQEIKNSGKWNEETQKYEVDVKVTGKNLLNLQKEPDVKGTCQGWKVGNGELLTLGVKDKGNNADIKGCYIGFSDQGSESKGVVWVVDNGVIKTNPLNQRKAYVSIFPANETTVKKLTERFDIQCELGNVATPYQPYTEQTMQIALDEPLRGIGEYNDVLTKDGVVMKVKRVVLDGSEDEEWRLDRRFENHINFALVIKGAITVNTGIRTMMDKFKYVRSIWNNDSPGQDMFDAKLRINMPKTLATDLQTFKTWLSQNPLTVDYVLAEPVTEPLPESVQAQLQALHSENGVTHVFVDSGEVPCGIKLTYRKEI